MIRIRCESNFRVGAVDAGDNRHVEHRFAAGGDYGGSSERFVNLA